MKAGGGLNAEQAEAVRSVYGPLLIFAGAGSGKTRVITHRIKHMVSQGIPASSIIAVTFTNKSAREMKERLRSMMHSREMRGMIVSTFHSLGNRILQKEIHLLPGYRHPFSILSPEDSLQILSDIYKAHKLDHTEVKKDGMAFHISMAKNSRMDFYEYGEKNRPAGYSPEIFESVASEYKKRLNSLNAVDFDDLILLPPEIFRQNPEVLERYRRRHRYYLIDEFQDTNPAQYDFLKMLVGPEKNICVVGDDDQSIYGWRGADINIILGFHKDFPDAKTVRLEYNYRSTEVILEAANHVIRNNAHRVSKSLKPTGTRGELIRGILAEDEVREAELIVNEIHDAMVKQKRKPGNFAILYRTNFQSRVFEEELRKRNIPHFVVGGYRFFDRREVKDMIAYLRYIANPRDEISLSRIINRPKRSIGDSVMEKINEFILSQEEGARPDLETVIHDMMANPGLIKGVKPEAAASIREFLELMEHYRRQFATAQRLSHVLSALIRELKWEFEFMKDGDEENVVKARMLNLSELANMMSYMEDNWEESGNPTLYDFLSRVSMMASDQDENDTADSKVQLLTLHLSKGLEYPVVFLSGMAEGIFPAGRSLEESADKEAAMAEERRLFYVGITRAREQLYLTTSLTRRKMGVVMDMAQSPFLEEVPETLLQWIIREDYGAELPEDADPAEALLSGLASLRKTSERS